MTARFRRILCGSLLLGLLAHAAVAQAPIDGVPDSPVRLVQRWIASNATCRNAAVGAADAVGACEQRDTLSKLLTLANYCHGPAEGTEPAGWTPCGGDPAAGQPSEKAQRDHARARASAAFQRAGGVFVLSAQLNGGTQAYFVVDSGAATVQIPEETAEEMKRAGTLVDADFVGQRRFVVADGRGMQQRVFRLKSLQIGGRTMENVVATIGAPRTRALLGQSYLRRLSWWKIDNVRNAIELEFTGAFP
jgi:clan AA aspartic protease (TIGR02281 family)